MRARHADPGEQATLAIPVAVDDVPQRTTRTVSVAVDSAVADPRPQDDAASVSFDVVPGRRRAARAGDADPGGAGRGDPVAVGERRSGRAGRWRCGCGRAGPSC